MLWLAGFGFRRPALAADDDIAVLLDFGHFVLRDRLDHQFQRPNKLLDRLTRHFLGRDAIVPLRRARRRGDNRAGQKRREKNQQY